MDWQFLFTWIAIGLAASYVLWRGWQTWRSLRRGGCSGGCGCAKTPAATNTPAVLIAPEDLIIRKKLPQINAD
jgi:hypothetical protein